MVKVKLLFKALLKDPIWKPLLTHRVKLLKDNNPNVNIEIIANHAIEALYFAGFRYKVVQGVNGLDVEVDTTQVVNIRSFLNLVQAVKNNPTKNWIVIPND